VALSIEYISGCMKDVEAQIAEHQRALLVLSGAKQTLQQFLEKSQEEECQSTGG